MKSILLSLFLFVPKLAISQVITANDDAVYLDSLFNMGTEKNYKYIRVVKDYYSPNKKSYEVNDFYKSGKIAMLGTTSTRDRITKNGMFIYYYENGNKKAITNYIKDISRGKESAWYENGKIKQEGEYITDEKKNTSEYKVNAFWDANGVQKVTDGNGDYEEKNEILFATGKVKNGYKDGLWEGKDLKEKFSFIETYNEGTFVSGISTDENNTKYPYKELITQPIPAKGMSDFYSYIGKNYRTPETQGLKGKVYTTFEIGKDGSITNIRVLRDVGYGTGKEAIRVIASYGKWIPGKMRGILRKETYSLPLYIQSIGNSPSQEPTYESEMKRNTNRY